MPSWKPFLLGRQVVLCRHEQDGDVFIDPPHRFCKRKTVCFRHHNVRDNQLVEVIIHLFVMRRWRSGSPLPETAVIQIGANRLVQLCIIFQNKNVHHIPFPPSPVKPARVKMETPALRAFLYYTTAPVCCGLLFQPLQVLCCANHHIRPFPAPRSTRPACSGIHHAPEHG